jgi:hypothetical protein
MLKKRYINIKCKKRQFCSELVANIYIAVNIIPSGINSKDIVPMDFFLYDKNGIPCILSDVIFITI